MLKTHLEAGGTRRFAVLHGARHSWDLGYRTELFTMQRLCSNFAYLPMISDPSNEIVSWKGPSGHVQDLWRNCAIDCVWGFHPAPSNTHIFLCGHPGMIEDMTGLLESESFVQHSPRSPGQIHCEKYW
jgi:ferredoxin--NADP+ reductase